MSSGRDVMMDKWGTDAEERLYWLERQKQRMIEYRMTVSSEVDRIDRNIVEIEQELTRLRSNREA